MIDKRESVYEGGADQYTCGADSMSKLIYAWWPYVRNMIKLYPERIKQEEMTFTEARETEAVIAAIRATQELPDGEHRLKLMQSAYWDYGGENLDTAALRVPCSYSTARRWNKDFFLAVAAAFGLWDPQED